MNETVEKVLARYTSVSKEYDFKRDQMQEVAEYILPDRANFFGSSIDADERLKIFDSTPEDCLQTLGAYLLSNLFSAFHKWFKLGIIEDETEDDQEAKEFLDKAENKMLAKFQSEEMQFQTAVGELCLDLPGLGNAGLFVDNPEGNKIIATCVAPDQFKAAENADGKIDTIFREFEMTAKQIVEKWPKTAPTCVTESLKDNKNPDKKFKILFVIMPREIGKVKQGKVVRPKHMAIGTYCIEMSSKELLHEGGFHEFPWMAPRWSKRSGETIGRGIGHKALPDIRVLNEIERSGLIATEKAADPTTYLPHDGFVGTHSSDGGALNFHRIQGNIRDRILTIGSDADLNAIAAKSEQKRNAIRRMFLNDKILPMEKQMTATEYSGIQAEKLLVLGPTLGRIQSELLAPLISRVFGIMWRNGEFGEIPKSLQGKEIKIQYISPIANAQKQVDAQAFSQSLQFLTPIFTVYPEMRDHFDADKITRSTQSMFGYPSNYLKSEDNVKKERQAKAQAANKQSQLAEASQQMTLAGQAKELDKQDAERTSA